ncbi:MAG: hypothetical protein A2Y23_03955 [Clostridiales bacterium GWB2_37_7]|nr:MAG: hypothetical protein A2Y23_03955 [Clostridiales bacterium GWB2_37_7]
MKSGKGQLSAIFILIIALFMQMEGLIPNIFAGNEAPIILTNEIEGVELKAEIESKSFNNENAIIVKVIVINRNPQPISYYAGTTSYGVRGVIGAALSSTDGESSFTDKVDLTGKFVSNAMVLEGKLESGRALTYDFEMLPFYMENGSVKYISSGQYILRLWYNKAAGETIKTEFPMKIVKRFGRMYIKL